MYLPTLEIVKGNTDGVQAKFYNSGHTVYVYIREEADLRPYLIGGPLKTKYIFEQMHFHWGSEDFWGSEHFIDGESFAVEIHAVHFNSKYNTFENASTQPDGLTVLTIFAEAINTDNDLLKPLCDLLPNVTKANTLVKLLVKDALQWIGSALDKNQLYYCYPGSLTTEPYSENVVFILLPEAITMSHNQLSEFRRIRSKSDQAVKENKRQLQPLHKRPIVRATGMRVIGGSRS
uniref:Carbonic anhydrase n=2 Tax=Graphocephala atropunctata TaxID=36148 RepID=A0A1B6LUD0_9HEMI